MKRKIVFVLASALLLGTGFSAVSCSNEQVHTNISITNTDKTVEVGQTLQLTVTGTEEDLTYTSSDTSIATVSETGLVTGVKEGKVTLTATLTSNSSVSSSIEIEVIKTAVLPTSVEITGFEGSEYFVGDALTLTTSVLPADAEQTVTWSTSDEEIASVSTNGEVAFISEGSVTITATSTADSTIKDEVTFNAKYIVDITMSSDVYDYSGLKTSEKSFKTKEGESGKIGLTTLNNVSGQYYVYETTVKVENPSSTDTWSRVGLGHLDPTNKDYFLTYCISPGPNMSAKKGIMMEIENNEVKWGATTDRSQMWNFNGVNDLDFSNVKLTAIRNGSDYYYLVNDRMHFKESHNSKFDNIDTMPIFHSFNCDVTFSNISYQVGEEAVSSYLSTHTETNDTFYPTYDNYVSIDENNTIKFTQADTAPTNNKDVAAKSIGDAFYLPAGKNVTVEFDFTIDKWGSMDSVPALIFTVNRWDSDPNEARSYIIAETAAGFSGWNSSSDLPAGIGTGMDKTYETALGTGTTYHAVCERPVYGNGYDTVLTVNGLTTNHGWDGGGYQGAMVGWFSVRNLDATISNITLTVEK